MAKKKDKRKKKGKQDEGVAAAARYRDALTGRFVTRKFAKKHRDTTVKELHPTA